MRRLATCLPLLVACGYEPEPPTELTHSVHDLALADDTAVVVDANGEVHVGGTPIGLPAASSESTTPIALELPAATAAAVGKKHACIISGGNVTCWGDAELGQLGAHRGCSISGEREGSTSCTHGPDVLPNLRNLESIAAGDDFTCAIDEDGRVFCWGDAAAGRLGGSIVPALDGPTPVTLPGEAKRLIIANGTACALLPNGAFTAGEAWCWGEGYGSPTKLKLDGVVDLAIGARHTCAITAAGLSCWGANHNGESGDIAAAHRCGTAAGPCEVAATKIVVGASEPVRVVVGERHSCALNAAGQVYCWGSNEVGQLGRENAFLVGDVGLVMDGIVDLASSFARVCATTVSDRAWCWGEFKTAASY